MRYALILTSVQETFVPDWGFPLLGFLAACLVLTIVLTPIAFARTHRAKAVAEIKGIKIDGPTASKSFMLAASSERLLEKFHSVVQGERRFSRVEANPGRVIIYVRGNIWTWGEIIEVQYSDTKGGTEIYATCRPRLRTTLFDYGQSINDLSLFIDLLLQGTESDQHGARS